ncbi:MAG: response regulator transcription factor, partial [Chloroflexi bacterium]|nr:response regulator transcription factor [Chloroflexota bacterium]
DTSNDRMQELAAAVSAVRGAGLPCVVLLPMPGLFDLDLAAGVVELCFTPFTAQEVEVRIVAAMQRAGGPKSANRVDAGELSIDLERYEVRVSGRRIDLTYKEYELLKVLASNPGRVFSREALLKEVWDYDYFGGTRTVDVHVRRVRAKTNDARHRFIETVRNVGYRFRTGN